MNSLSDHPLPYIIGFIAGWMKRCKQTASHPMPIIVNIQVQGDYIDKQIIEQQNNNSE